MSQIVESSVDVDDFQERYVAFLDLLGFKAQVERAERNIEQRVRLREILSLLRDTLCESPSIGLRFTYFSDCIVLSAQRTLAGLWEMFQSIDLLTFNLLQYDVFMRGGLTAGLAHHSEDFVYGVPLIRAYKLESESAGGPMTLVAQEVLGDARTYGPDLLRWLVKDTSTCFFARYWRTIRGAARGERYFVNYLRRFAEYRREPRLPGEVVMDDPGQRVIHFVCKRLKSDTGSVRSKAEWLQAYWNRTVAKEGVFGTIEPGLAQQYVSSGPTIIERRLSVP